MGCSSAGLAVSLRLRSLQGHERYLREQSHFGLSGGRYSNRRIGGKGAKRDRSPKEFRELDAWMRSQRYSPQTIKAYMDSLRVLARWFNPVRLQQVQAKDLIRFNNDYILAKGYSATYQNQMVNALKLYLKRFGDPQMDLDQIHRPRRAFRLPHVLSKQEVKRILESLINRKHRAMLSLIYACGSAGARFLTSDHRIFSRIGDFCLLEMPKAPRTGSSLLVPNC